MTNLEYQHFEHLINSNCSNRVHEYVCHMLEPECRPSKAEYLKPCRRICKGATVFSHLLYLYMVTAILIHWEIDHTKKVYTEVIGD